MKILIPVDVAFAFDFLSILWIKFEINKLPFTEIQEFTQFLATQMGEDLFYTILRSEEYLELKAANKETFDLVDAAKEDKVKASDIDRANYKRFTAKQKIQQKYFHGALSEVKIGYEKYG